MVQLTFLNTITTISVLSSFAVALSPGSYFIQNIGFPGKRVITGSSKGVVLPQEGFPVTAFGVETSEDPLVSNNIFTVDSTMTTLFNEETQQFAVVDASDGGSAGVGVILCNTTVPVAPFIPIGNSDWSFQQGSQGIIIRLSGGRNLAWSLQAPGFGTQITLQPLNLSDLKQQWIFTAHTLL